MNESSVHVEHEEKGRQPLRGWVKILLGVVCALTLLCAFIVLRTVSISELIHGKPKMVRQAFPSGPGGTWAYPAQPVAANVATSLGRPPPQGYQRPQQHQTPPDDTGITSPILALQPQATAPSAHQGERRPGASEEGDAPDDALGKSLRPTHLTATSVMELPDPNFTIGQGRMIFCDQVTALSTAQPGAVSALVRGPVKADTGNLDLLDDGSRLFGVIQHAMVAGADVAAVLWMSITTPPLYDSHSIPHRYRIEVDSPATDEQGRTGLPGDIDRHLDSKIPALIGVSLLQSLPSAAGAAISAGTGGNSALALNLGQNGAQGAQSAADSWLNRVLSVPDVLTRLMGRKDCALILMRDLNMRPAYDLHLVGRRQ